MVIRKSSEQIKKDILFNLKEGPLSTKKLSNLLKSNWSTINTYLEELKQKGCVREVYSRENLKVYVRTDYPVFYGLPLDKEKINNGLYLLSKIVEKWKIEKNNQVPSKTTTHKIAVEIIQKNPSFELPIVRFHYGKMMPLFFEPSQSQEIILEYEIKKPKNSEEILKAVKKEIKEGKHSNIAWIERKKQYEINDDMKIFQLKERISYLFYKEKVNENIQDILYNLFIEIPTTERYSYLFKQYHDFLTAVDFILNSKEFKEAKKEKRNYLKEIFDTFNSLWQALTMEFFFEDFGNLVNKDFEEIKESIKNAKMMTYSFEIEEKLNNLLEYKKSLTKIKQELIQDEKEIMNILLEGANEE